MVSHRLTSLSIILPVAAGLAMLASAASAGTAANGYNGRWTVSEDKPVFSARGLAYKTIDIAACGNDYCGVSVGAKGACGPVLFRFLAKSINGKEELRGHGRWGDARKNIEMFAYADKEAQGGRYLYLNLGDGHDFGERSGNMPKFSAGYRPVGAAHCVAR